jgi:hypothetical protein
MEIRERNSFLVEIQWVFSISVKYEAYKLAIRNCLLNITCLTDLSIRSIDFSASVL